MSVGGTRFAARFPVVWHVIEADGAGTWLHETGLLPAATLRALAGAADDGANRDSFQRLELGGGRIAVLRPQLMADRLLTPTLVGAFSGRPELWRRHIDQHVFFWTEQRRCEAFLRASRRWRVREHAAALPPQILAFATARLLVDLTAEAFFARINTGSTLRGGGRVRRDEATFARLAAYRSGPVAELAVRGPVSLRSIHVA